MHTLVSYFGFFWVFLDKGFSWGDIFGSGLGFRDDYVDLDNDRKIEFAKICMDNAKYLNSRKTPFSSATCTTEWAEYRQDVLSEAQAAFFIAIIWGQLANIFIRKTFSESILNVPRLLNNKKLFLTVLFEIALGLSLIYVPKLNTLFLMRGIKAEYLFCTIWYIPFLVMYEEVRKFLVRLSPKGCVAAVTQF